MNSFNYKIWNLNSIKSLILYLIIKEELFLPEFPSNIQSTPHVEIIYEQCHRKVKLLKKTVRVFLLPVSRRSGAAPAPDSPSSACAAANRPSPAYEVVIAALFPPSRSILAAVSRRLKSTGSPDVVCERRCLGCVRVSMDRTTAAAGTARPWPAPAWWVSSGNLVVRSMQRCPSAARSFSAPRSWPLLRSCLTEAAHACCR